MAAQTHPKHQYSDSDEFDEDFQGPPGQRPPAPSKRTDRIRRSFHQTTHDQSFDYLASRQGQPPETIQVTLNEGYFAAERRQLVNCLANVRQKLSSVQLFNPAKDDQAIKRQEEWTEKEKYTLDSLNEFKGNLNGDESEKYQWNKPNDGREVWPSKLQYFLAITSYSVGLGNVIRFPILVQKNGGLAFILPFLVMLVLEGIPLLYLELAIGQRMRKASITCWNLVSPLAMGIGLASASVSFIIGLYYNTIVTWTLLYLYQLASPSELIRHDNPPRGPGRQSLPFVECPRGEQQSGLASNWTNECLSSGPYEFYWYRRTLNISDSVNQWAPFNWPIFLCLICAWLISYCCLMRGLSSSKRIVYVISLMPYVILVVFFFKSISLPGSQHGIQYFFAPQWDKLVDPFVWLQAAAQVFFSLGLGFGGLIALSSYNPINNNCYKDAIRVSLVNFCLSIFAGVVIFASLGFKANLSHHKCLIERDRQIDFYLADYNLKVLDYGAVFAQVPLSEPTAAGESVHETSSQAEPEREYLRQTSGEFVAMKREEKSKVEPRSRKQSRSINSERAEGPNRRPAPESEKEAGRDEGDEPEEAQAYDYNSEDAIASINNLDRQLDLGSASGSFDYGDSDIEFVINASNLISRQQLDQIVANIPNLARCSLDRELDEATQGNGLIFVVMAEALSELKARGDNEKFWVILFYLMILTLGFDSQFGNLEGLLSSLMDLRWINRRFSRQLLTALICALSLILSAILFAHAAGSYLFAIFDEYAASVSLVLIALFELLAISYVYGLRRFCDECELMTGSRPHFLILLSWRYLSPMLLLVVVLATLRQFTLELNYEIWAPTKAALWTWTEDADADASDGHTDKLTNGTTAIEQTPTHAQGDNNLFRGSFQVESWPSWCIAFGSTLVICCIVWIPLVAIMRVLFRVQLIGGDGPKDNNLEEDYEEDNDYQDNGYHRGRNKAHLFPAEELREYHSLHDELEQRKPSRLERILFGFTDED